MTTVIEALCRDYERQLRIPWEQNLPGAQRVWFVVYPPVNERRLRLRLPLFENATKAAQKHWRLVDLTKSFAAWMAVHEDREAFFEQPEALALGLSSFERHLAKTVTEELEGVDASTVVALSGVASLFGLASVSRLVAAVSPSIRGRLLVFFPGHTENNLFKLLDATSGYNYLAVAITTESGGAP